MVQSEKQQADQLAKTEDQQTRTGCAAVRVVARQFERVAEIEGHARFAGEFRAQLDEERNRRLGRGTNHLELRGEKRKRKDAKKDKKSKKVTRETVGVVTAAGRRTGVCGLLSWGWSAGQGEVSPSETDFVVGRTRRAKRTRKRRKTRCVWWCSGVVW